MQGLGSTSVYPMIKMAEKLEFMTGCTVEGCATTWIGRKAEHKNPGFRVNL